MATPFRYEHPSEHPAQDVWNAVLTPLSGEVAATIYPWFNLSYLFLEEEMRIVKGTQIHYGPNQALVNRVGKVLPELRFTVEDLSDADRLRVDVLNIDEAKGRVAQRVEEVGQGSGLLIVEGELEIAGFLGSMAEGPAIKYAIERPAGQLVGQVPEILRQI